MFMLTSELELPSEKAREIIREIVENIASSYSSKPSLESILKRIKRNIRLFYEYIVSRIVSEIDTPSPRQLEYIITRGGRALVPEAGMLYRQAVKQNREDLVDILRNIWNIHGPKGMINCPRCGFNSVAPDRSCLICGNTVPEDHVRNSLGFNEKFELYLKTASVAELNETLQFGYVLLGDRGVYCPRSKRAYTENPVVYAVYLRRNEVSLLIEEIHSRELPI